LATASAQVCVPLGHSSLYFSLVMACPITYRNRHIICYPALGLQGCY